MTSLVCACSISPLLRVGTSQYGSVNSREINFRLTAQTHFNGLKDPALSTQTKILLFLDNQTTGF